MNAAELLKMDVSDVLRMNVTDLLGTNLSEWKVPERREVVMRVPVSIPFDPEPGASAFARSSVREVLSAWAAEDRAAPTPADHPAPPASAIDEAVIERAQLVVSEFVTRTIEAGSGGTVVLRCVDGGVHVEVTAGREDFDARDQSALATQVTDAASAGWGASYTWPHYRAAWSDVTS